MMLGLQQHGPTCLTVHGPPMWSGLYELSIPLTASISQLKASAAERLVTSEFGAGTEARTVSFKI